MNTIRFLLIVPIAAFLGTVIGILIIAPHSVLDAVKEAIRRICK